ncbi:GntR family transcriptional regulator [Planosporangium flavigriseum]|nr:GntR family transcriptional regulator [Planosporangium flavigriseum]NJC63045.1 GntR family transcriptional regulator [Planosporangium flavigriseum]
MKDEIVRSLQERIISGDLEPGEKLSEQRLAREFGVSRQPVREALKALEIASLVTIERRRGTFVRGFTRTDVTNLYEVREGIEGMAARLCAIRGSKDVIVELEDMMQLMKHFVEVQDVEQYLASDEALHRLIFVGANNDRLVEHYNLLILHIQRQALGRIVGRRAGRINRSYLEVSAIVQAIRDGDGDRAESAMRIHVQSGRKELTGSLYGDTD